MAGKKQGCLPWVLGAALVYIWINSGDNDFGGKRVDIEQFDPQVDRSPRRPLPQVVGEIFMIEDSGPQQDSQGTAFAVDRDGIWLTAQHVTHDCDRVGLVEGERVELVGRVLESREADVSIIRDGPASTAALPISIEPPQTGDYGYHMGFPAGVAAVVISRFMGTASASRGPGGAGREPIYAWAEESRSPSSDGPLGGISGGPTLDIYGNVVGVNSASTNRRGRVLTTDPNAMMRLIDASGDVDERAVVNPLPGPQDAVRRFRQMLAIGTIRQVYCDVQ